MSYRTQPEPRILPSFSKDKSKVDMEEELSSNYLDIWELNPSYKDINARITLIKAFSLILVLSFLTVITYQLTLNFYFTIGLTIFILLFFILTFSDNFFNIASLKLFLSHGLKFIEPFKNLEFWTIQEDPATCLINNRRDSLSIAVRIFKVDTLPENVHPTLNQFLKALNKARIQFTYQVVQNPILGSDRNSLVDEGQFEISRNQKLNSNVSVQTSIYFCFYNCISGLLTNSRIAYIIEKVSDVSKEFKSNFYANFHHTKISLLVGNDLINAIRTSFCKASSQPGQERERSIYK